MARDDPRRLWERIDADVRERIEEAIDAFCLDLLVRWRRERGRPMPVADSQADRAEFEALVGAFLRHLDSAMAGGDTGKEAPEVTVGQPGLLAAQVAFARRLPDYWKRFEAAQAAFVPDAAGPEGAREDREPGAATRLRDRLFGRRPP